MFFTYLLCQYRKTIMGGEQGDEVDLMGYSTGYGVDERGQRDQGGRVRAAIMKRRQSAAAVTPIEPGMEVAAAFAAAQQEQEQEHEHEQQHLHHKPSAAQLTVSGASSNDRKRSLAHHVSTARLKRLMAIHEQATGEGGGEGGGGEGGGGEGAEHAHRKQKGKRKSRKGSKAGRHSHSHHHHHHGSHRSKKHHHHGHHHHGHHHHHRHSHGRRSRRHSRHSHRSKDDHQLTAVMEDGAAAAAPPPPSDGGGLQHTISRKNLKSTTSRRSGLKRAPSASALTKRKSSNNLTLARVPSASSGLARVPSAASMTKHKSAKQLVRAQSQKRVVTDEDRKTIANFFAV